MGSFFFFSFKAVDATRGQGGEEIKAQKTPKYTFQPF